MEKRNNNEQKKIDNVLYILGLSGCNLLEYLTQ